MCNSLDNNHGKGGVLNKPYQSSVAHQNVIEIIKQQLYNNLQASSWSEDEVFK